MEKKKFCIFKNFCGLDEISLIVLEWEEFLKPTRLGKRIICSGSASMTSLPWAAVIGQLENWWTAIGQDDRIHYLGADRVGIFMKTNVWIYVNDLTCFRIMTL